MQALSRLLGDETYFFAATHAFVAEIAAPPVDSPLRTATLALRNLTDHFQCSRAGLYT
jgi:hypothetical protein